MTFIRRLLWYCAMGALVWFCLQVAIVISFFAVEQIGVYPLGLFLAVGYWPDTLFEWFHPLPTNWGGTGGAWWLNKAGISLAGWLVLAGLVAVIRHRMLLHRARGAGT
jgi:hypothetical protein